MKKLFVLVIISFTYVCLYSQPLSTDSKYTRVYLSFYTCKHDTIKWVETKKNVESINKEYSIICYEIKNDLVNDVSSDLAVEDNKFLRKSFQSYDERGIKRGLRIEISKNQEKMIVMFKINKNGKPYTPFFIRMSILFQEGVFEVSDPKNPKLVPIKEE